MHAGGVCVNDAAYADRLALSLIKLLRWFKPEEFKACSFLQLCGEGCDLLVTYGNGWEYCHTRVLVPYMQKHLLVAGWPKTDEVYWCLIHILLG